MPDRKNRKIVVPPKGGATREFVNRLKLILKLLGDPRVNPLVKLIPVGALVYLVWPFDALVGPFDDAAVLWIGSTLFVELCPPDVVQEHMQNLNNNLADNSGDIVDADVTDVNDK